MFARYKEGAARRGVVQGDSPRRNLVPGRKMRTTRALGEGWATDGKREYLKIVF